MSSLQPLIAANRRWSEATREADPEYFARLARLQEPRFLWIGCADSRVPANVITGMAPGEVFVHRNVANVVAHTDLNCLSVVQYAVEALRVEHVIVCGHYGCGGVAAAMGSERLGLIDNWLRNIRDVADAHAEELAGIDDRDARLKRLCELNVEAQVANLCHTTIIQDAWARGQSLHVHGLVYGLEDGLLRDLGLSVSSAQQVPEAYRLD
jgi:carbonic anhydrase